MKNYLLITALLLAPAVLVHAQTNVTFSIDMRPVLSDTTFPYGVDQVQVQVVGNLYPLGRNRNIRMTDTEPVDSVYSAEINFPSRYDNQVLQYNFKIITPDEELTERNTRELTLRGREMNLPPLIFNAFAW